MQKLTKKSALLGAGTTFLLLGTIAGIALAGGKAEAKVGVSAAALVRAITAAGQAKAGEITTIEVEVEDGKTMIDVKVLALDGKTYEVGVEAATGKVVSVEAEDEDEDEGDEKGEGKEKGEKEDKD